MMHTRSIQLRTVRWEDKIFILGAAFGFLKVSKSSRKNILAGEYMPHRLVFDARSSNTVENLMSSLNCVQRWVVGGCTIWRKTSGKKDISIINSNIPPTPSPSQQQQNTRYRASW
jgi:hypothetical protein